MDFMSDIWLTCDSCGGMRYNEIVLSCTYQGLSIGEVLRMTVQEAIDFFESHSIVRSLTVLKEVGVEHLVLGQSSLTISGGEAQRLKLANSIINSSIDTNSKGRAKLYLFDEPSTGLHYFDILKIIKVFHSIIKSGHTILFIEHNNVLIESADRTLNLGPGSGENGGKLIK